MENGGQIQAVIFNRDLWTRSKAQLWLRHYDYRPIKPVHITADYYRYRIHLPEAFSRFETITHMPGLKLIIGY